MRLQGRKIIITGASRGIGRGIARVLGREGATLGLVARTGALLEAASEELLGLGATAFAATADLGDPTATRAAIDGLAGRLGGLDALINNAGLVVRKDILALSDEEWVAMVNANIHGVFYATRAALPHLRAAGAGHIITISSISGKLPLQGGSGYSATKHAATGLSESIFLELRDLGIKVTTIYPGSVDTESHRVPGAGGAAEAAWKVRPEDIGEACLQPLLASSPACISQIEVRPLRTPQPRPQPLPCPPGPGRLP